MLVCAGYQLYIVEELICILKSSILKKAIWKKLHVYTEKGQNEIIIWSLEHENGSDVAILPTGFEMSPCKDGKLENQRCLQSDLLHYKLLPMIAQITFFFPFGASALITESILQSGARMICNLKNDDFPIIRGRSKNNRV